MPVPLFLVGFMAAGKTTVGRLYAQATHRRFIDLDDVIAERGTPVADLVARDEPAFRRIEAETLAQVIADSTDAPIIATGGGCAAFGDNMTKMRSAGLVVALDVDLARARARAEGGPTRPLLSAPDRASDRAPDRAAELAAKRAPAYRRAHAVVDTSHRTLLEVVAAVADVEHAWQRLPSAHRDATLLSLDERTYPVVVHDRAVDGDLIRTYVEGASRVVVITDHEVAKHWQTSVIAALGGAPDVLSIEPGEASKSLPVFSQICEALVAGGLDRGSVLIALGGGVIGDLTGFIASALFRGIPVIQLPTTLVAMTDASIGGKTAVDLQAGKNLVGAFWQPRLVACGLETLTTLPVRERRAGFGELWKYALLDGDALWQLVDSCAPWASGTSDDIPQGLREVIQRSIAYKAAIVGRDEREITGQRALLNLGHTVGHAIESATGLHHGEAVGLGLIAAARVSAAIAGAPSELEAQITAALRRTGLPAELDPLLTDDVLERIKVDKKRIGDKVRFIAVREVGACDPVEITITELRRILRPDPTA